MDARLKMGERGYGEEPRPTGEIEVWDGDAMQYRLAKPEEIVPALLHLVAELYAWKQRMLSPDR